MNPGMMRPPLASMNFAAGYFARISAVAPTEFIDVPLIATQPSFMKGFSGSRVIKAPLPTNSIAMSSYVI